MSDTDSFDLRIHYADKTTKQNANLTEDEKKNQKISIYNQFDRINPFYVSFYSTLQKKKTAAHFFHFFFHSHSAGF